MKVIVVIIGLLADLFFINVATAVDFFAQVQLPPGVKTERPGPEVPPDVAKLAGPTGKWAGQWEKWAKGKIEYGQHVAIAIVKLTSSKATIIWAAGDNVYTNRPASCRQKEVAIEIREGRPTIIFTGSKGKELSFWIEGDVLKGSDSFHRSITMRPIP